jgi:hypothetical protein
MLRYCGAEVRVFLLACELSFEADNSRVHLPEGSLLKPMEIPNMSCRTTSVGKTTPNLLHAHLEFGANSLKTGRKFGMPSQSILYIGVISLTNSTWNTSEAQISILRSLKKSKAPDPTIIPTRTPRIRNIGGQISNWETCCPIFLDQLSC